METRACSLLSSRKKPEGIAGLKYKGFVEIKTVSLNQANKLN
jgi:hypothetical protein